MPIRKTITAVVLIGVAVVVGYLVFAAGKSEMVRPDRPVVIKDERFIPNAENIETLVAYDYMRAHTDVQVVPFTSLQIRGGLGSDSAKFMAFAGKTAPDIIHMWFHKVRANAEQGFLLPLNEWIGYDGQYPDGSTKPKRDPKTGQPLRDAAGGVVPDTNGKIDPDETRWAPWTKIDPYYRMVATVGGKVYAIPFHDFRLGLLYRLDLWREAGLDPGKPPETWDELYRMLQKLTDPKREVAGAKYQRGQFGFGMQPEASWEYQPWWWSTNSSLVVRVVTSPTTGKEYRFKKEALDLRAPDTGEDLNHAPYRWEACFADEAGMRVLDFIHKLAWQPWILHVEGKEKIPIDLTDQQVRQGWVMVKGRRVEFTDEQVITGVARLARGAEGVGTGELLNKGEVAVVFGGMGGAYHGGIESMGSNVGFMAFPAEGPNGQPALFRSPNFKGLNSQLSHADQAKRDHAFALMADICVGSKSKFVRLEAEKGAAKFFLPEELEAAGLSEYIQEIPAHWLASYKRILKYGRTEPYEGKWQPVMHDLGGKLLSRMLNQSDGKTFDYRAAAIEVQESANTQILRDRPEAEMRQHRRQGWVLFAGVVTALALLIVAFAMSLRETVHASEQLQEMVTASSGAVASRLLPWLLLAPALVSIALWAYYPLARGSVMAFQDYRIVSESKWVGLDNFIGAFLSPDFWMSFRQTFKFAAMTLALTFFAPITLAVLLNEVPLGKYLFRTIFYLPQVSSPLVIALMWQQMYNPTDRGLLNQINHAVTWSGPLWKIGVVLALLAGLAVTTTVVVRKRARERGWSYGLIIFDGLLALLLVWVLAGAAGADWSWRVVAGVVLVGLLVAVVRSLVTQCGGAGVLARGLGVVAALVVLGAATVVGLEVVSGWARGGPAGWYLAIPAAAVLVGAGVALAVPLFSRLKEFPGGLFVFGAALTTLLVVLVRSTLHADVSQSTFDVLALGSWFTSPFKYGAQDWLGSARWAMAACIVPATWGTMGAGCLIYLAALKSVAEDNYEAAEIDGAGILQKLWHITIPTLKPLIIINFVGAFIGAFQNMQNIFVLTGGGPGNETKVLSLSIWYEAFVYLRFGPATSMAWVLGLMLIGFTVYQLRILRHVEFRRAEEA